MDTYYTIEEKYLQAVDELSFGETPKGLNLLNAIIADDATYARAHHQLGKIYYYDLKDYQTAGFHFKTCMELEPTFPDNYSDYLSLVVFLKMERQVGLISAKALTTPGVDIAEVYGLLGLFAEKNKQWPQALQAYRNAYVEATDKAERDEAEESIERVKEKMQQSFAYQYTLSG
jgi:tetratricopeptide (TPR) repeat protein